MHVGGDKRKDRNKTERFSICSVAQPEIHVVCFLVLQTGVTLDISNNNKKFIL